MPLYERLSVALSSTDHVRVIRHPFVSREAINESCQEPIHGLLQRRPDLVQRLSLFRHPALSPVKPFYNTPVFLKRRVAERRWLRSAE